MPEIGRSTRMLLEQMIAARVSKVLDDAVSMIETADAAGAVTEHAALAEAIENAWVARGPAPHLASVCHGEQIGTNDEQGREWRRPAAARRQSPSTAWPEVLRSQAGNRECCATCTRWIAPQFGPQTIGTCAFNNGTTLDRSHCSAWQWVLSTGQGSG